MNKETLRMQMLSGVITESEYKTKLEEFDMDQFIYGDDFISSPTPKASFEDKWNDVPNANKEILKKSTGKEPVKIMASSKGTNYAIAKGPDGKFYRYQYTQAENPGKPMGPFSSEDEAKKLNESLNENFVGMGMVGNIFDREKTDYELAFEHFTKGTSLNEMEDEMPKAPSHEETDANQVYEEKLEELSFPGIYMELKDLLFPYYTDLRGEERVAMIDNIIGELNSYISVLQDEKTAK